MKSSKKIIIFERPYDLSIVLLKHWFDMAQEAISERGRFCAALQGSESLCEFFSKLSGIRDYKFWENVHLFQTDQFHVSYHSPRHQFQFLRNNLIDYISIPAKNVHPILTDTENPAYSADQYEEDLTNFFELPVNDLPIFDCIIMGLNEIDHLRPLFQQNDDSPSLAPIVSHERIKNLDLLSIHPHVLGRGRHVIFIGAGANAALNAYEMIEVWGKNLPAVKDDPNLDKSLVFLLDSVAAHQLPADYEHFNDTEGVVLFNKL